MIKNKITLSTAIIAGLTASSFASAATLDTVKERGTLVCGATTGVPGFSVPDENNHWKGLDIDFCRAVAAAIFGDAEKVKFSPLTAKERFTALQSGEIDLLSRITTETMSRDTDLGINFVGTTYYDGQGFMVPKSLGIKNASELAGATVCTETGTTTELNITDYFKANNMEFSPLVFEKKNEALSAYDSGRCDLFSTDISGLTGFRTQLKDPSAHIILPNVISKEPLTPAVRHGDDQWLDLVNWTRNCLINAEELGVTSKNVEEMKQSNNPSIQRLLGISGDFGKKINLNNSWCADAIAKVGNYGEIYNNNLGPDAGITIDRGLNNLWNNGGILFAAPIR